MKSILVFAVAGVLTCSCSNSTPKTGTDSAQPKQNAIEMTNDMENAVSDNSILDQRKNCDYNERSVSSLR